MRRAISSMKLPTTVSCGHATDGMNNRAGFLTRAARRRRSVSGTSFAAVFFCA